MESQSSFCWHCRKRLGGHHQKNKPITFAVIVDALNHEHRIHKNCAKDALADGEKLRLKTMEGKE